MLSDSAMPTAAQDDLISICVDLPDYLSLAYLLSHHAALRITLSSKVELQDVGLRVSWTPAWVEEQSLWIPKLAADKPQEFRLPVPTFDAEALKALTDETDGTLRVELSFDRNLEKQHVTRRFDFGWIPMLDARIVHSHPELAAALVLPGAPATQKALAAVQQGLGLEPNRAWVGYSRGAEGVVEQCRGLWAQLRDHEGEALENALHVASCLAGMGIHPLLVLLPGHVLVGAKLSPDSPVSQPADWADSAGAMEAWLADAACLPQGADAAEAQARQLLRDAALRDDAELLDIDALWQDGGVQPVLGGLPAMDLSQTDAAEAEASLISTRPRTRVENWQRKLLDLSLRNNLLNTRPTGKNHLVLLVSQVAQLEDMLSAGSSFRLAGLPDDTSDPNKLAEDMFRKRILLAETTPDALQRTLKNLYSASRREMEESGSNTLFIACGFLSWVPKGADRPLRAPLLLLPVRLNRQSVRDGFTLSSMDEEAQINQTLLELLKTEFGIRLPALEEELPKDDSGLDVPLIMDTVRKAIAGMPGWEVQDSCLLGIFSFAKFLMWRDLRDRQDMLMQNAVVHQLAAEDRGRFPEQQGFPELSSLDHEVDAHLVYTPLAADSSQLAAILAAARGKSFVLEGPPGTGKSQTIANMIAHCLGHGKTVLFVAEKAVALEVVHKRLTRLGLGNFCLELHSNKTLPSAVMQQFREAVEGVSAKRTHDEWDESVDSLTGLRAQLNDLPEEMHRAYPDGASLYAGIAAQAEHPELPIMDLLHGESPLTLSRERKKELLACAHELATHVELISGPARTAAQYIHTTHYSPAWESSLAAQLQLAAEAAERYEQQLTKLADLLGVADEAASQRGVWVLALQLTTQHPGADWEPLLPSRAGRMLRALRALLPHATEYQRLRAQLSLTYPPTAPADSHLPALLTSCRAAQNSMALLRWWVFRRARRHLQALAGSQDTPQVLNDLEHLCSMHSEQLAVEQAELPMPEFMRRGVECTDAYCRRVEAMVDMLESSGDESFARRLLELRDRFESDARVMRELDALRAVESDLQAIAGELKELLGTAAHLLALCAAGKGVEWAETLLALRSKWRNVTLWNLQAKAACDQQAEPLVAALQSGRVAPHLLEKAVETSLAHSKLMAASESVESLRLFSPAVHESRIHDFAESDAALRAATSAHIRALLAARSDGIMNYDRETAILQRELSKKRMYMPLRKLLAATPHIAPLLKPCFLMSPLSVARYLADEMPPFDVVIFDEASQIPVWDAIGAIGRGHSVIITGDSKQMPPTSFFSRSRADNDEEDGREPEMESILDECLACGVPKMNLSWHYRSKSESLIAFSNEHYYEGKMTTFPAPALQDMALQLHYVGGVYEPGATRRVNEQEARSVVDHVLATLRAPHFRYTEATSIGIVTFNIQQQKLIADLFEEARAADPALEPFFAEENPEAIFIKNLENVQGDERGVIYFSTTYGPDAQGRMVMNFGPLNLVGGERRLNVAITRARYEMHVFTSMRAEDISRARARGVVDLRAFLEYAQQGSRAGEAAAAPERRDALAQRVARDLEAQGWQCRTGIGASDYQVDIAVAHPDIPNAVLAGITLDGASYHAAHTARDRDVVRPGTMELLGWRMIPVWSIDWWRNPEACLESIQAKLEEFRRLGPPVADELPDLVAPPEEPAPVAQPEPIDAPPAEAPLSREYRCYEPAKVPAYLTRVKDTTLTAFVMALLEHEAPMPEPWLLTRVAQIAPLQCSPNTHAYREQLTTLELRLHDVLHALSTSGKVRRHMEETPDGAGEQHILSLPGSPAVWARSLGPRELEQEPLSELGEVARLVQENLRCIPGSDDHLRGMADFLGLGRLTKKIKDQLSFAVRNHHASSQSAASLD